MDTNSSENTTDEQLVALNQTPQPRDPYCFVDPDEEFEFQSSSSSPEDFQGFNCLDRRHARRQLLFRRPHVEVSASSSDDEEGDFQGTPGRKYSSQRVATVVSFVKTVVLAQQVPTTAMIRRPTLG